MSLILSRVKEILFLLLSISTILFSFCSPKPYLISDLFRGTNIEKDIINRCVAVVATDRLEYIICEAEQNRVHIKVIPSSDINATMVVTLEDLSQSSPLGDIIDRNINQVNISISYKIYPEITAEMANKNRPFQFSFRSLDSEKYRVEGLIIVSKYIIKNISGRDKLR